ncbi:MAG: serine hydrolase domain-containing protein [Planctomycetaceae bacterium]
MNSRSIFSTACVLAALATTVQCFNSVCAQSAADSESVGKPLPTAAPEDVGMAADRLAVIADVVADGISRKNMPGCVVLVGRKGHIVYHEAFGHRQLVPEQQPMHKDTVFDMASLTKPVATATSVMSLVEQKLVDLEAPVARYIPQFGVNGKDGITVRQLLVHSGGLIPDNSMKDYAGTAAESFEKIHALPTHVEPGSRFVYTDVGFIVLAELVERVSGKNVHEYSQQHIFGPLGMTETGYVPNPELQQRAAVTQEREGRPMRGEVHDPRAYALGGIAGHAGLFSTASDLSRYCQMMINRGSLNGVTVLQPTTVEQMTAPVKVSSGLRTLGWDMKSPYSSNRGDLFSSSAFGHGGFMGTSMWIDPERQLFVIFLSNRVHPDGSGSVNPLAGRIGTIAAAAICE